MRKLFIREDYEHGYVGTLRDRDHRVIQVIETRGLKVLQLTARNYKAEIIPKRFAR